MMDNLKYNNNQDSKISQILENLNEPQIKATTIVNGAVQVIAGAGSGKTRVIAARIAYLISQGISPYQILALTFTNKAAREMKSRIARIVGESVAERIWAGTFHSIFARILRYESQSTGYSRDFSIYDTEDSRNLIKEIFKELNINSKEFQSASIHGYISKLKNELIPYQEFQEQAQNTYQRTVGTIYQYYQTYLKDNNAMDFDDLLLITLNMFENDKDILEKYQSQFKYILVDEFQDTNRPQYLIVRHLSKAHSNIFVVGDDAQSIYRWRGADIRNILEFTKDFPDAKQIRLEQNYRSTRIIIDAAHSVIENNKNQIKKKLWTENEKGELIEVLESEDDNNEGDRICAKIIQLLENKFNYEDIAILYRTNAQSLLLERALRLRNIPYQVFGGLSFYQRKEIKDVVSYLRLLINPDDSVSLLRIINEPPRGIGRTSLDHLITYARTRDISLFDAFVNANNIPELQNRAKLSINNFVQLIKNYQEKLEYLKLEDVVPDYIKEVGILEMYQDIDSNEMSDRWNNIQQLLNDIIRFSKDNLNLTLSDYLQQVSLLTDFDTTEFEKNKITLMTLHTAKGLEFPVVFITGLEKGLFPIIRNHFSFDEEEEERRLFYVGITRAKKRLYLTYAKRRSRFGYYENQAPSNFLYEINKEFLLWNQNNIKPKSNSLLGQEFKNYKKTESSGKQYFSDEPKNYSYSQLAEDDVFRIGERVRHAHFGEGKIIAINGTGQMMKITVEFPSVGRKQLMAAFAKLQKIL
jgi:DNA helicase-2/ATP-dependent DNA helicase PcrA